MPDQIICDIQMNSTRFFIIQNNEVSAFSNEGFTLDDVFNQLCRYINTTGINHIHLYGSGLYIQPIIHFLTMKENLYLEVN
jgi:hypothetical protein